MAHTPKLEREKQLRNVIRHMNQLFYRSVQTFVLAAHKKNYLQLFPVERKSCKGEREETRADGGKRDQ